MTKLFNSYKNFFELLQLNLKSYPQTVEMWDFGVKILLKPYNSGVLKQKKTKEHTKMDFIMMSFIIFSLYT